MERLPLDRTIRPTRLFDLLTVGRGGLIGEHDLARAANEPAPGEAVVLWTGHDAWLESPDYFWHRPELSAEGAAWSTVHGAAIVAADFPGLGGSFDDLFQVKRILHRGGVITVEQLCNLAALEGKRWHLCAPPLRTRVTAGSLVQAFGLVGWGVRKLVNLTLDMYGGMPPLSGAVPTF